MNMCSFFFKQLNGSTYSYLIRIILLTLYHLFANSKMFSRIVFNTNNSIRYQSFQERKEADGTPQKQLPTKITPTT